MTDIHARMLAKPVFVVTRIKKNGIRPVEASVLFDEIGTLNPFNTQRDGGDAPVGRYTFNQQTTITSFSVLNALSTAGDLKFLIFNSGNGDLLFSSNPKTFASDGGTGLYHFSLFASQRMQAWQAFERGCLSWI